MNSSNICKFLPNDDGLNDINILNFVYETESYKHNGTYYETVYKIHLVTGGSGFLQKSEASYPLKTGDIFFTFPSERYSVGANEKFEYIYISFIGIKINKIMDKLNITKNNFLFNGFNELIPIWEKSISDNKSILNLRCEGILLYSLSLLGEQIIKKYEAEGGEEVILTIKKYIDESFCDKNLCLDMISRKFSYNKKYISGRFKKSFNVGIAQYITTLRIQKAHTLIESGFTSVKEISDKCGYGDSFYFSRVFKEKTGLSPKEYIRSFNQNG